MTHTEDDQPDTLTRSKAKLRDLLTTRSYLRDRIEILGDVCDESPETTQHERQWLLSQANVVASEVSRLNKEITKAESEAAR